MRRKQNDRWVDLTLAINGYAFFCCCLMALGDNKFSMLPAFMNIAAMAVVTRFANINYKERDR